MIANDIIAAAQPYLKGRIVKDMVIGLSLVACELDDGMVGISYVHRDDLPPGCGVFGFVQENVGKPADEIAAWLINKSGSLEKSISLAVLCAASHQQEIADDNGPKLFGLDFNQDDTVGMIGLIAPIAEMLKTKTKKVIVFDKAIHAAGGIDLVHDNLKQRELLPTCNKLIITGSSLVNGSTDELLSLCPLAEQIIMVGTSTPMFAQGWQNTKVTALAGSHWQRGCKDEIFKIISLAGGIAHLQEYMRKKVLYI